MTFLVGLIVTLSLPSAFVAGAMYYHALFHFSRTLEAEHPGTLEFARSGDVLPRSRLNVTYKILRSVEDGAFRGIPLSPATLDAWSTAKRLLYVSVSLVFVLILSGLSYDWLLGSGDGP